MAFYYVKLGGTATGDAGRATTKRTGSFASMGAAAYYDRIEEVYENSVPTTAPAPGDNTLVSSEHRFTRDGTNLFLGITLGQNVYSVDDLNADTYKRGAKESVTGPTTDLTLTDTSSGGATRIRGIDFSSGDDIVILEYFTNSSMELSDCELSLTGGSTIDTISLGAKDGAHVVFSNVDLSFATYGQYILQSQSGFTWDGGQITGGADTLIRGATNNAGPITLRNLDLRGVVDGVTDNLSTATSDSASLSAYGILLDDGVPLSEVKTPVNLNVVVEGYSIGRTSAPNEQDNFEIAKYAGSIFWDNTVFRSGGRSTFSARVESNANNAGVHSLSHKLVTFFLDTSTLSGTLVFKLHCAHNSSAILDTSQVGLRVWHKDGASIALGAVAGSEPVLLGDPVQLSVESGGWTGLSGVEGTNHRIMSLSSAPILIGNLPGNIASGPVSVAVFVVNPSGVLFLDVDVDVEVV